MHIPFSGGEIRPWRLSDAEILARLADDREVWRNLRDAFPHPYTRRDARAWIRFGMREFPVRHFAVVADFGTEFAAGIEGAPRPGPMPVGGIGIQLQSDVHEGTAEIGYWLGRPFWGRGLMTAALDAFTRYSFETFGLRRVYARVFAWNPASLRVLEKCGYAAEGRLRASVIKDGEVTDEILYARIRPQVL